MFNPLKMKIVKDQNDNEFKKDQNNTNDEKDHNHIDQN